MADERKRILVVDDEPEIRTALGELLRGSYAVQSVPDAYQALALFAEQRPDVVITDLRLPGVDGIQLMRRLHELDPDCPVLLVTASRDVEQAVLAIREGAAEYLPKPIHVDELLLLVARALERRRLVRETCLMRSRLAEQQHLRSLVGASPAMALVREQILQIAPSRASVLLIGESGTGKERVAAAIHEHSPRAGQPFVKLSCATLSESLMESELFGHERGAFTGATTRREGRFRQADGGTLFLDEIGEIPTGVQIKLLRFLQEREFERVGGSETLRVDVRLIAATHRDLGDEVRRGRFREDFLYRLDVVRILVPPLRERRMDIPLLAEHFLRHFAERNQKTISGLDEAALEALVSHAWPGNVRELENAIERAVVMNVTGRLGVADLPAHIAERPHGVLGDLPQASLEEIERYVILRTLEQTGGNRVQAARLLGVSERTIRNKLRRYTRRDEPDEAREHTGSDDHQQR